MKLDTLYKRTKTGKAQYWKVEIENDNAYPVIVKESGQLGTDSPIIHREGVTEGKQKRSLFEQAQFQACSDWKRKKDEGYKSLEDLGIGDIDSTVGLLQDYLNKYLPKFNTDSSGNIKPMLATDWKKVKKIEYPCYCEPKLDGVRCLMIVGEQTVTFLSRSGKIYNTLMHLENEVLGTVKNVVLDGEIYSDELTFQEIVSAVKAYKPITEKLHFRAYDIVTDNQMSERHGVLDETLHSISSKFVTGIDTQIVHKEQDVIDLHNKFVTEGYEGAMLRMFDGSYEQGTRSRKLLKVKEFDETEFDFLSFEKGQRDEDLIAVCGSAHGKFKAKMVGTRTQKELLYNEFLGDGRKDLGSITIKHFGCTEDGLPRFPIGKSIRDYE